MYCLNIRWNTAILVLLFLSVQKPVNSQNLPELEEIIVSLNVQQIGARDIPAIIKGETLYLPVCTVFNLLKIHNISSDDYDSVSGFFINEKSRFLIDQVNNKIVFEGKVIELNQGDLIRTNDNLYLQLNYFGEVFGLECTFYFRNLAVALKTKLELPAIREMRQEMMRQNINKLKGESKADTIIPRSYPFLHFGIAEWTFNTTEQISGQTDVYAGIKLGGIIAGGEANISLFYNKNSPFKEKNQSYLWHYANNENKLIKQVFLGKIPSQAMTALSAPVLGVMVTNTPTSFRRSFCAYILSDYTEPGWIVELYVNNILVDYVKADASGFFTFQVPLVYGNSVVTLHFYGPWGEERSFEKRINIPFNFLPPKTIEYSVNAGVLEDDRVDRFSRISVHYGLGKRITIGGGLEYNTSITKLHSVPFINFSTRLGSSLLITADYIYGARLMAVASYRLPSDLQFEVNYTRNEPDQNIFNYSYLEERKAVISYPLRTKIISTLFRLTFDQIILSKSSYFTTELLVSGSIYGVSTNFTTNALFTDPVHPYIYSTLSLGFSTPFGIIVTTQAQFQYKPFNFITAKLQIQKKIFRTIDANLNYDYNFRGKFGTVQAGFRVTLPFAQTGVTARYGKKSASFIQSGYGSLLFDAKNHYVGASNRSSVGKGGLLIAAFFDLNENGHREPGEPRVPKINVSTSGGRIETNKKDSTIRISDLEAFTDHFIVVDKNSFDNIAWQVTKPVIKVNIEPNHFKLIEVPVSIFGEANGMVYYRDSRGQVGQDRIIVKFYNRDSKLVAQTMTESDGYFSFLGFKTGEYTARIDDQQMQKLNMTATPEVLPFVINQRLEGDLVEELNFIITPNKSDTLPSIILPKEQQKVQTGTPAIIDSGTYMIQVDTFFLPDIAKNVQRYLTMTLKRTVVIVIEDGFYSVRIPGLAGRKEAELILRKLENLGMHNAIIDYFK